MVRPIVHDPLLLCRKSEPATAADRALFADLKDTLRANEDRCVGMAANMIGVLKNVIVVATAFGPMVMVNPVITRKSKPYGAEEGCLSLSGTRKTTRYETIFVSYQDENLQNRQGEYTGFLAQIIQHEVDHCSGILI